MALRRCHAGALRAGPSRADRRQTSPLMFVQQAPELDNLGLQATDLVVTHSSDSLTARHQPLTERIPAWSFVLWGVTSTQIDPSV